MEFVHGSYEKGRTIAAIATPPGEGGISVIRISGNEALTVADKLFSGNVYSYKTHTAHLGKVLDPKGFVIDEALLLVMLGNKSFTGEDTVEIQCHGGRLITQKILQTVLSFGASPALAGEFSFKAYMNDKIDLTQAEAIQDLISAKNGYAMKTAKEQLLGSLKDLVNSFQAELVEIAAVLEAWVDYPEEGLDFMGATDMYASLKNTLSSMKHLRDTFHDGHIIKDGISLCLVGLPNAGKSSLLNALLKKDRAIVTEIEGTTRDVLEEDLTLGNLNFRLIDTAGIRKTQELVEKEGIKRSEKAYQSADIILFVIDLELGFCEKALALYKNLPKNKTILVFNKNDSKQKKAITTNHTRNVFISAKNKTGLLELKEEIFSLLWEGGTPPTEEILLTNSRHFHALSSAIMHLENVLLALETNNSPEIICLDIKDALKQLGSISGTDITEDVLGAIFSKFCVGK